MKDFTIQSKIKDFQVKFVDSYNFIEELKQRPHFVLVGNNVYKLYKQKIFNKFSPDNILVLELDEQHKTLETANLIYKNLLDKAAKKNITIVSFGGGINQDVTGFAASTLYRGVNWIYVPTTLLAMADSSIGLKTSLNFQKYKNVLGSFYPPSEVYINVDFLVTLTKTDYLSGVGEIIKLLLMDQNADKKLEVISQKIAILNQRKSQKMIIDIIGEAMKVKLSYMEGDEFDLGRRNLLNYGHEFGHALEPASAYTIPHGIAVMIGIMFANYTAVKRKLLPQKVYEKINNSLLIPNILATEIKFEKKYFDKNEILNNMKKDKKRISEGLVLVLPQKDLSLKKVNDLIIDELHDGIIELTNRLSI